MKNIEELLEKYWNAETTIEEEKQLKAYFQSNDVDDQHKAYSTLFSYFDEESQLKSDFNPLFKVEALAATPNNNTSIQKETKVISLVSRWRAVAALLIFALGRTPPLPGFAP
ncbi:MAG TPA: hypothetical protein PKD85_10905, partial [Saprospiraceae bacterium]|nr:hypothetical protein [Saprospiraceae bacterium]